MELEKLATSAVIAEISKTDRLSSFINSGDKEPCWDGHIYIHEDKNRTKKNLKKVAVQVKGKAVSSRQVKRTINYPVCYDDLNAYMMNDGTVFFVVLLDKDTGNTLQIYYRCLLPMAIKGIFKVKKNSYSLKFNKFPADRAKKTELFLNYYEDSRMQASFAGRELPTIDDLSKKGILESLSFSYTGIGDYSRQTSIPKMLNGNPITLYANITGGTAPIPIEYFDSISHVTLSGHKDIPVCVAGKQYYSGYNQIITEDYVTYHIGSSVVIKVPNSEKPVPLSLKIHLAGKLTERIASIEFIAAMVENKSFHIGAIQIPANFSDEDLQRFDVDNFSKLLNGYRCAKSLLDKMNVKKDLDVDNFTVDDVAKINTLIGAIGNHLPVKNNPGYPANIQKMTISNLTLAVVYIERAEGGFDLYDYFGSHLNATWAPDGSNPERVSQFFSMGAEDYLTFDNLNLDEVVKDFKAIPPTDQHMSFGNTAVLNLLEAYDKQPSPEFLKAAQQLCEWQLEYPDFISANISVLNRLQTISRERELTFQEKTKLHSIAASATDTFEKIGAFLLLDEQNEARNLFNTLSSDKISQFETFPIYKFYKYSGEE